MTVSKGLREGPIYLDYNATTPVGPRVVDAWPFLAEHFGNPSSSHVYGHHAHEAVTGARFGHRTPGLRTR